MNRAHHFSLCFMGMNGFPKQCVLTAPHKCITVPIIAKALKELDLPTNCPLMSVSYLGYMSREEFESGEVGQ